MIGRLRRNNPLPDGAIPVGVGLLVNGVGIYLLFAISSRALDEADYSALVVLWTLVFAIGNGVMQPLEQEVARAVSDRRARHLGSAPVIRRASAVGLAFTVVLWVVAVVARDWLTDELFNGESGLFVAFLVGLFALCVAHLVRGTLSSHGRFVAYGSYFGLEGLLRPVLAGLLAVAGVVAVGPYGAVIVTVPLLAALLVLRGQRGLLQSGPQAPWSELTANLGWLLLGTLSIALLLNGGAIAVALLATEDQDAAAGVFQNGMFVARVPLFLFQAVLAALLPALSHQLGRGAFDAFSATLARLLVAIGLFGVVATAVGALLGPAVIEVFFGSEEVLGSRDVALLVAASVVYMAAVSLSQALIALNDHARMAVGAAVGLASFAVVTMAGDDLFLRVETGLLVGSLVTFAWMGAFVVVGVRRHRAGRDIDLAEAAAEMPLQP